MRVMATKKNYGFKLFIAAVLCFIAGCSDFGTGGDINFTVNFDSRGGTHVSSQTVSHGSVIFLPFTSQGDLFFHGWYTSASGGYFAGMDGDTYRVVSNITLFARWGTTLPHRHTVIFDSHGGTTFSNRTVNHGDNIILPSPTRTGYIFGGWFSSALGSGTFFGAAGDTYTVNSDVVMVAFWIFDNCRKPATPTGVSANAISQNSVRILWGPVNHADNYDIYRSTSLNGIYDFAGTTRSNSFIDDGLFSQTTYFYRIAAINSCGESALSNVASATTLGGTGTLVIRNISNVFSIIRVFANGVDLFTTIPMNSERSFRLDAGDYEIEVVDNWVGGNNSWNAFIFIASGQTKTLVYDGESLR